MVAAVVAEVPGTRDVSSSMRAGRPEVQVIVDRDRAASYGLSVYHIASSLRTAVDGAVATLYRPGGTGTEVNVTVQLAEEWRRDVAAMERVLVATPTGVSVPLYEVASVVEGVAPVSIDREDQARVATVSAHIVGRDLSSVVQDIEKRMETVRAAARRDVGVRRRDRGDGRGLWQPGLRPGFGHRAGVHDHGCAI